MRPAADALFRDRVRDVVLIASASRSGSSLFAEWLRRSGELLHLRGEPNPLLRKVGLMTGASGADGPSDALTAHDVPRGRALDDLLARDVGRPAPASEPLNVAQLAADWLWRLEMEWPDEAFEPTDVGTCVTASLRDVGYRRGAPLDLDRFSVRFVDRIAQHHPCVSPYRYDVPAKLVRTLVPGLELPDGPPGPRLVEEPPFILVVPWERAAPDALSEQTLVLKTPSAGYQLGFYRALFRSARLRVIHLVRNPAASINGLLDGWAHHEFFSRHLPDRLRIRGYTDLHPTWGRSWWKFDLPPGWEEVAGADIGEVCAFQWASAHRAILRSLAATGVEALRVRFEDFVAPGAVARMTRDRVREWIGMCARTEPGELPQVMSTTAPRPFRWRDREDELTPLLASESVRSVATELGYGDDDASWR
ncbi:MAG: hypothetical protein KF795_02950 [Labilithrix sp.]|nr:hypothetical protein [Labilithrix sp.]